MKNIAEIMAIVDEKYTHIPLLQRNYKWSMECAAELAEDIWDSFLDQKSAFQLNMITIHRDVETDTLQILDGQQRLITLKLLLEILEPGESNLNYDFERDLMIDERSGRRYFINHILPKELALKNADRLSVDTTRLWDNYNAMIIPLSFRTVYLFYVECLAQAAGNKTAAKASFVGELNRKIVRPRLLKYFGNNLNWNIEKALRFDEKELENILEKCDKFQMLFTVKESEEDISNDEIRVSENSESFQRLWNEKEQKLYEEIKYYRIIKKLNNAAGLADYIKNRVEMLYHETSSEPIDEFLNINENKTRFVISDYIRANMISDNPVDGDLSEADKKRNQENRNEVLQLFASLSVFLYSGKYAQMWELIKKRYDDFEKHPDINRLKVLFCDKYAGTSTKGYVFEQELTRLRYFNEILSSLSQELGLETKEWDKQEFWNTYNAVYMLLECKDKYRFFNIFTTEDIAKHMSMRDVVARERFCFFEWAYNMAQKSDEQWDISYFLESQLYKDKCNVKKAAKLPKITDNEWCCIDRGNENDKLNDCIERLIESIKENKCNG